MDSDAIERIETRIAFLERANADLSDAVFRQHRDIEGLRERVATLAARLQAHEAEAEVAPHTPEQERPPHY